MSQLNGYVIVSQPDHNRLSNSGLKSVSMEPGAWLANFKAFPALYAIPLLAFMGAAATSLLVRLRRFALAFIPSGLMVACTIATAGVALFPFLMTSSLNPSHSLTVWDASSSRMTLWLMTIAAVISVLTVLTYIARAFRIMREALSEEIITKNSSNYYQGGNPMWYFAWILGLAMAVMFGILNAMWLENETLRNID